MDIEATGYFLSGVREGEVNTYSLREDGGEPRVLLFQERDDAERYVIMMEQDDAYAVGDTIDLVVNEAVLGDIVDILNDKGHDYLFVRKDDLFIPPPTD
tara:strand:+ start:351 stop:647 length:297 start_codon:yes stop_codon:yes gene_type:complete